jgi:hypothetical protein
MAPGPSPVVEKVAGFFIPPACREEVLGDLRERYRGPAQYFFDAVTAIPCVIYSRIRRTTDAVLILVEWMSIYAMLVFATLWLNRATLLEQWSYLRLAIPPTIILAVTTLVDAYADPRKRRFDPLIGPGVGLGVACAFTYMGLPGLPVFVFNLGGFAGTLIVATLRVMFPPIADQPVAAKIPAFWRRLELVGGWPLFVISFVFLGVLFEVVYHGFFAP